MHQRMVADDIQSKGCCEYRPDSWLCMAVRSAGGGALHPPAAMPPRKRAKSSAPVPEVSTLWTCDGDHNVSAVASDGDGNVFVASETCIYKLSGGEVTVVAGGDEDDYVDGPNGKFNSIAGLAVDTDGCLIVSESGGGYGCIRKVALDGQVSTVAGDPGGDLGCEDGQGTAARFVVPDSVAMDCDGSVLVADGTGYCIRKVAPDGTVSTLAGTHDEEGCTDGPSHLARFDCPQGVALDVEGNVLVADYNNHSIRKIARDGVVSTLAGSAEGEWGHADGAGGAAGFDFPCSVAVDIDGTIVVADCANRCIRKVTAEGVVSTLAGPTDRSRGSADGPANSTARFADPVDVAIDENGNVLVADRGNKAVRQITHTGLSRGAALPRWPVGKPALATNLLALLDDERFADVSFGTHAARSPHPPCASSGTSTLLSRTARTYRHSRAARTPSLPLPSPDPDALP